MEVPGSSKTNTSSFTKFMGKLESDKKWGGTLYSSSALFNVFVWNWTANSAVNKCMVKKYYLLITKSTGESCGVIKDSVLFGCKSFLL